MIKCKLVIVLQIFLIINSDSAKQLPAGIDVCHKSDPQINTCLAKAIFNSLHFFKNGVPMLDMPPLDPLKIDYVVVDQDGGTTAFNLKSSFRNAQIDGLAQSTIPRAAVKFKKFAMKAESFTNQLDFYGHYTMNGQVLILPIRGEGFANVSMHELTTRHEIFGDYFTGSDGNKYVNITKYSIKFKPKWVKFRFDNLFNGDRLLGDTMNKFMNENWEPVFNGMIPGYEVQIGERFKKMANLVFSYVPFDMLLPE